MPTLPNILLMVADQMAAGMTGAYGGPARTPAMDALAAEGARFDAAYTPCPLCTPARASLLTGRFPSRTRTYDNASILPADVPTWAHSLRSAGYEVVAAGKMHMVGPDQLHGIERRLTPDIYPTDFAWTPADERYDAPPSTSGNKAEAARSAGPCDTSWQLDYDENVHRQALAFLRGRPAASRPFCLVVSYTHPHPPYWAPRAFWDLYEGTDMGELWPAESEVTPRPPMDRWLQAFQGLSSSDRADADLLRRVRRAYVAMVSYVDSRVGELLAALGELSLADQTAVMLTSDHGEMLGSHGHVEKRLFYEQAVRVPLLVRLPGRAGGQRFGCPASLMDLGPTLIDLAGGEVLPDTDGASLMPMLNGGAPRAAGPRVLSEYLGEGVPAPCFLVREGPVKYLYAHGGEEIAFDLSTDSVESTNVADQAEYADVLDRCRAELLRQFDIDALADDMLASRRDRMMIHAAMQVGRATSWPVRSEPADTGVEEQ